MRSTKAVRLPTASTVVEAQSVDGIADHVGAIATSLAQPAQAIRAELIGSNRCTAAGLTATGHAPVLELARLLIEAGHDPARPLHAYRGDVLCIKVRSIAEGAALTVDEHNGTRLAKWKPFCRSAGSPTIAPRQRAATTPAKDAR